MPSNRDQRKVVHTSCRRRFPHPYCFVRVGGIDYQVPLPNRVGWTANAPPRKGINWCPSPRMKGETAELSKLMQSKREEKTTSKVSVSQKKERGRRLKRKENAKLSAPNFVATVQVQVAPKPGDNLSKAIAETEVMMIGLRPGKNLFREKEKGPPKPKESSESKVLTKLKQFTKKDQELMLARFADMLDLLTFDIVKGRGEMGQEQKAKKAMEKAAGKKAAEEAKAAAGPKVEMPTAAGHKEEADEPEPQIEEPDVKGVAAESDVVSPVPEESLPQIAEPKEAEAIVAAVVELGAVEKEVGRLKLETERLVEAGRERERALKQLDGDVESIFARLGELESEEAKAAAAGVLERRLIALEDQNREAKARELEREHKWGSKSTDERIDDIERERKVEYWADNWCQSRFLDVKSGREENVAKIVMRLHHEKIFKRLRDLDACETKIE